MGENKEVGKGVQPSGGGEDYTLAMSSGNQLLMRSPCTERKQVTKDHSGSPNRRDLLTRIGTSETNHPNVEIDKASRELREVRFTHSTLRTGEPFTYRSLGKG